MATGDQQDIYQRLISLMVPWFGDTYPNLTAILEGGFGTVGAFVYSFFQYVHTQTRIKSSTGDFLDLVAQDFYGVQGMPRHTGETDASYLTRILSLLLIERATRNGMDLVLTALTGRHPVIIEGFSTTDVCAYDVNFYYDISYSGGYGFSQPYTAIIYAFRPQPAGYLNGLASIGTYDADSLSSNEFYGAFGYDFNFNNAFFDLSGEVVYITDQDILNAIQQTKQFGTLMLTTIFD